MVWSGGGEVEVRERRALSKDRLPKLLSSLSYFTVQGMILSTCDTMELIDLDAEQPPVAEGTSPMHRQVA